MCVIWVDLFKLVYLLEIHYSVSFFLISMVYFKADDYYIWFTTFLKIFFFQKLAGILGYFQLWIFCIKLFEHSHIILCVNIYCHFLWAKHLEVEFLGLTVNLCLTLWETSKLFSKGNVLLCIPTAKFESFSSSNSLTYVAFSRFLIVNFLRVFTGVSL